MLANPHQEHDLLADRHDQAQNLPSFANYAIQRNARPLSMHVAEEQQHDL